MKCAHHWLSGLRSPGSLASLLAGLATAVGALPAFAIRRLDLRAQNLMLGFAAGVMLAASFFSMILPALDAAAGPDTDDFRGVLVVSLGVPLGAAALWAIHASVPHEHFIMGREGPAVETIRRIWLFVIAITLHNFPEGLAVAFALLALDYSRATAFLFALASDLVEPIGGILGITAVSFAESLLPWGLAFAAGAMIFVISDEVIPETHRHGAETSGTAGLMAGFVVMMWLDVVLG